MIMSKKPNIVIICTDQQQATALSCAGHPDVNTPNLDRLAGRGTRFTNAYCTNPLCTPARLSMWTGRMPHELQGPATGGGIPPGFKPHSLGRWLRDTAGYRCVYGGKWHAGGGIALPEPSTDDLGFEKLCGFDDNALTDAASAFLRTPPAHPFLLVACFDNPHNICESGRNTPLPWGEVGPEVDDLPASSLPNLPPNYAESPYEPQPISVLRSRQVKTQMDAGYTPARWRRYRYDYFRMIEKVDAQIGGLLEAIDASGLVENTVVIVTSDHGEMAGAHRLSHKQTLYGESARVPLIFAGTGIARAAVRDELVSVGLDLLPTVCDIAKVKPPDAIRGLSIRPLLEPADSIRWRDYLVCQTNFGAPDAPTSARLIRTPTHAYHCHDWGQHREQLFDLRIDPGECINLAIEMRYRDVLNRHRKLLADWCAATNDAFGKHYAYADHAAVPGVGWQPLGSK